MRYMSWLDWITIGESYSPQDLDLLWIFAVEQGSISLKEYLADLYNSLK